MWATVNRGGRILEGVKNSPVVGRILGRKINWAQEDRTWRKNIGAEESDAGRQRRRLVWKGDDMLMKTRQQMEGIEKLGIFNL
ncbi:hypothetical protein E6C27_scaffold404G00820 [Cucumis melo var. makuwa]|uniref:Uncharacterized protein n=1 Tax=Cucumis melo var. makuwa TaxID=1194695 RepID=A0A5A7U4Q0_CUCMM|nr:hypothetical protein E6C27_scaffold404G00820 [Cucumis melo var. makuwa]